jgi:hypothetical protein
MRRIFIVCEFSRFRIPDFLDFSFCIDFAEVSCSATKVPSGIFVLAPQKHEDQFITVVFEC